MPNREADDNHTRTSRASTQSILDDELCDFVPVIYGVCFDTRGLGVGFLTLGS